MKIAAIALILLCTAPPSYAAIIKGPYLQRLGTHSITVMWETDSDSPTRVEYGRQPSLGRAVSGPSGTMHMARLTALREDSAYYYRAVSGADESSVYSFRTASSTATSFRFVAMGDSRSNPKMLASLSGMIDLLNPKPALAVYTGDMVTTPPGDIYDEWGREFFVPQQNMMAALTVFPAIGNHESGSKYYSRFFDLPGGGPWYSFEYGNAVFIALDTNSPTEPGSAQYQWFEDTLKRYTGKTWKFVFFHHPPYSTGQHGSEKGVRENLRPLLMRYHVNIVFNGHDHDYERSEVGGTTYIVTGGYGAELYPRRCTSPDSKVFVRSHHFCVINVAGNKLKMSAIDVSGATIDSFGMTAK